MELNLKQCDVMSIASLFSCKVVGENKNILKLGNLSTRSDLPQFQLTYVNSPLFINDFNRSDIGIAIIKDDPGNILIESKTYLITEEIPETVFYYIFLYCLKHVQYSNITQYRGHNIIIAPSATIYEPVIIEDGCIIMDNVVIMPNTILRKNVIIKPNSVIGSDGFQVKVIEGKRKIIPHVGGVELSDDVEIGACVTIDRGLFGEFTYIGKETKIDNQVYVGHSTVVGEKTSIAAGVIVAGNVWIGNSVWIGIGTTVNQLRRIGDFSLIGAQSAVTKDINDFEKVFGVPAKIRGWVCMCGNELEKLSDEKLHCPICNTLFDCERNKISVHNKE